MKNKTKNTAVCGLMTALSVVLMMLTTLVPVFMYVIPIITGLLVLFTADFANKKWGIGVYFATAFVTLERGHSNMDLLTRRYPSIIQKVLNAVAYLVGTVIFGYIGYLGVVKVLMNQLNNNARINETLATSFPQWPFGLAYSFGFFLLAFSCLWGVVRILFGKAVAQDAVDVEATNKKLLEQAAAEAAVEEAGKGESE